MEEPPFHGCSDFLTPYLECLCIQCQKPFSEIGYNDGSWFGIDLNQNAKWKCKSCCIEQEKSYIIKPKGKFTKTLGDILNPEK